MTTLRFVPLAQPEYDRWWASSIREYAEEHVKSGNWTAEEAAAKSEGEFRKLLPQGTATPGHYLFGVEDPAEHNLVGVVWFRADRGPEAPLPPVLFIYDLIVFEAHRGKGYGTQAMGLIEDQARLLGFDTISLHVFGHNTVALSLYRKLGYAATNLLMSKKLDTKSAPNP
ncbi:MAG: GNAT family N-acetyltransferase [Thermoplasmata archaeon]|nr:GNAT family N-acetyltransferase [Thermoplasmata archaeon]